MIIKISFIKYCKYIFTCYYSSQQKRQKMDYSSTFLLVRRKFWTLSTTAVNEFTSLDHLTNYITNYKIL